MSLLSTAARTVADWVKLGFPEEVAKRIVSGEIPADKAEKAKRTHELRMEANANRFGDEAPDTSYRGSHAAPDKDYGAPLHNLTDMIPEDVYGPSGKRLYGIGDSAIDDEAFSVLNAVRGNPDAGVTMYRAVPSDAPDEILDGDWVTTSREYAHMHGRNTLDGDYKVLEEPTFARRLQSEGYPYEFGYMQNGKADPRLLAGIAAGGAGATAAPSLLQTADHYSGQILEALEKPYRGLLGLTRFGGGLLAGEGFEGSLRNAVRQIEQPIEDTAEDVGDSLLKTTGSPAAATLGNLLIQLHPTQLF